MLIDEQLAMAIRSSYEHDVARAIAHPGVLDVLRPWRRSRRRRASLVPTEIPAIAILRRLDRAQRDQLSSESRATAI